MSGYEKKFHCLSTLCCDRQAETNSPGNPENPTNIPLRQQKLSSVPGRIERLSSEWSYGPRSRGIVSVWPRSSGGEVWIDFGHDPTGGCDRRTHAGAAWAERRSTCGSPRKRRSAAEDVQLEDWL